MKKNLNFQIKRLIYLEVRKKISKFAYRNTLYDSRE
jgi:hypothetical protein